MEDARQVVRLFKALSSETRVRILQLLKDRALCVGALAARLGVSSAAVSQHLRILRNADLVLPQKHGYYVHYRMNQEALHTWRQVADGLFSTEGSEGTGASP